MRSFHRKLLALCVLSAGLAYAPLAHADTLKATGFTIGSQDVTLTSPGFVLGPTVHAGALNLNHPAGLIGYHGGRVPEPATWVMLAAGLGLIGFRARRRAQREAQLVTRRGGRSGKAAAASMAA